MGYGQPVSTQTVGHHEHVEYVQQMVPVQHEVVHQHQIQESVVEVPQVHTVEKIVHVPRVVQEERVIHIPRVQTVERIEEIHVPQIQTVEKVVQVPQVQIQQVEKQIVVQPRVEQVVQQVQQQSVLRGSDALSKFLR